MEAWLREKVKEKSIKNASSSQKDPIFIEYLRRKKAGERFRVYEPDDTVRNV